VLAPHLVEPATEAVDVRLPDAIRPPLLDVTEVVADGLASLGVHLSEPFVHGFVALIGLPKYVRQLHRILFGRRGRRGASPDDLNASG